MAPDRDDRDDEPNWDDITAVGSDRRRSVVDTSNVDPALLSFTEETLVGPRIDNDDPPTEPDVEPPRETRPPPPERRRPCLEILECPDASLVGRVFPIEGSVSIGRREGADLRLLDQSVSRDHARIFMLAGEQIALADLTSTNGCFVNGVRVQRAILQVGDMVRIGRNTVARFARETGRWSLRLTDALIAARVALVEWSPSGFDASRNFADVVGLAEDQIPTSPQALLELVHPDDRERAIEAVRTVLGRSAPIDLELRFNLPRRRGEASFSFKAQARRVHGLPSITVSVTNITARKRAEREIQRLTLVLENMYDSIVVLDLDGRITGWTARAEETFQLARDRALGSALADLVGAEQFEVLQKEVASRGTYTAEIQVDRGGRAGVFEVAAASLKDDDDWVVGYVIAFRDVTQKSLLQQQLIVSDKLAAIGTLAAGMAHEINNPLAAMVGGLDYLAERLERATGPSGAREARAMREVIDEMRAGAARIVSIVASMKTFSRTDERPALEPVELAHAINLAERMVSNELRQSAELTVAVPAGVHVRGYETGLMQVFINLLVNAAHAIADRGGAPGRIEVRVESSDDESVVVAVEDNGCGMSAETQANLFTPFFTTKPAGKGTGLGLSVTRTLIEGFGGTITVDTAVGRGTTMRVRLPRAAMAAAAPSRAPTPAPSETARKQGRILIIDDEPMVVRAMSRLLRSRGYLVEVAPDGETGVERAISSDFDVIVCDVMMPGMTGLDVYQRLSSDRPDAAARVIFVTGGAFSAREQAFVTETERPVLSKPWSTDELVDAIETVIAAAAQRTWCA